MKRNVDMEVNIKSINPDSVSIKFENNFVFDTWDEALRFIEKVDDLYHTLLCQSYG